MRGKELRNIQGITLIALVITIIVLLILAGVSVSMLSGNNGVLQKATEAKQANQDAKDLEKIQTAVQAALINPNNPGKITDFSEEGVLKQEIEKEIGTGTYIENGIVKIDDNNKYVVLRDGSVYKTVDIETAKTVSSDNMYVLDSENSLLVVPIGFKIIEGTKISDGIVIQDESVEGITVHGSEFVWVPVQNAIYDGTTEITVGTYTPMARKQTNAKDYQGVLYDLDKAVGSQKVYDLNTYGVGTTNYREPSLVTDNSADTYAVLNSVAGTGYDKGTPSGETSNGYQLAGCNSINEFGTQMQTDYNSMVESVSKYGGFYVGRYETGVENGKAVSKNANTNSTVTTADASQSTNKYWYGLYKIQTEMISNNNIQSNMIWGSQYDAMMNWMINEGKVVGTGYDSTAKNTTPTTGKSTTDVINKIYDLYGCHLEWTFEALGTLYRDCRGGGCGYSSSPSERNSYSPIGAYGYNNSRLTIYIK